MKRKCLKDCTRADLAALAEAASELYAHALFHYWLRGDEGDLENGPDNMAVIEGVRKALARCGLRVRSYAEYRTWLEARLHRETRTAG